jgi:hypothetical protein
VGFYFLGWSLTDMKIAILRRKEFTLRGSINNSKGLVDGISWDSG